PAAGQGARLDERQRRRCWRRWRLCEGGGVGGGTAADGNGGSTTQHAAHRLLLAGARPISPSPLRCQDIHLGTIAQEDRFDLWPAPPPPPPRNARSAPTKRPKSRKRPESSNGPRPASCATCSSGGSAWR